MGYCTMLHSIVFCALYWISPVNLFSLISHYPFLTRTPGPDLIFVFFKFSVFPHYPHLRLALSILPPSPLWLYPWPCSPSYLSQSLHCLSCFFIPGSCPSISPPPWHTEQLIFALPLITHTHTSTPIMHVLLMTFYRRYRAPRRLWRWLQTLTSARPFLPKS